MFPIVRPWTIQPPPGFARSADGVFASLVFGVVGDGPDLISGAPPIRLGSGSFGAARDGVALKSTSNTADGAYYVLPADHPLYLIDAEVTIFQIAQIDSWAAYSSLLCVPYRVTSWADPYGAFGLQRDNTNNAIRVWGSYGGTGAQMSNTNTLTVTSGGRYVICASRYQGGCRFLINGAYQNTATGNAVNSGFDFVNKQPLAILNRSNSNAGEGTTGSTPVTLIFNRALTEPEMRWLAENYWQVAQPRRIWLPSPSAGGSSLDLTQTTGVVLSGAVSVSGDIQIGTSFNLAQSAAVGLSAAVGVSGDIQIGTTFDLAQTAAVGLTGSTAVIGDLQILSGSLDLTQTAPIGLTGSLGTTGDVQIGTSFNLTQTVTVGLTGSVGVTGDIQVGTNFNLVQSGAVGLAASLAVSGDLQSGTAPVVTQAYGNFGWDPRIRPSWKRKELREELEAALDDAPKAVQELVRVSGPDISEVPVREALEVVRTARKHRERAVTRQEIDELHEALETVATFTREREAARQVRRRKQQHLLLLS